MDPFMAWEAGVSPGWTLEDKTTTGLFTNLAPQSFKSPFKCWLLLFGPFFSFWEKPLAKGDFGLSQLVLAIVGSDRQQVNISVLQRLDQDFLPQVNGLIVQEVSLDPGQVPDVLRVSVGVHERNVEFIFSVIELKVHLEVYLQVTL